MESVKGQNPTEIVASRSANLFAGHLRECRPLGNPPIFNSGEFNRAVRRSVKYLS